MALVNTTEMFKKAYANGYAIGAFNVNNMEIVQGITEACSELNAPVILQVSAGARKYANHTYLLKLVEAAVKENPHIPMALHLDHGDTFELCKDCVDGGFTSVMIDGSHHDYEDNVALTRKVVEYAHAHGVTVEGELGRLAGIEDDVNVSDEDASYTNPAQVQDFVDVQALIPWPLPSEPATVHINLNPDKNRNCVLTFCRKYQSVYRVFQLYCTVLLPLSPNLWR